MLCISTPYGTLLFCLMRILMCHACARTHCLRLHAVPPIICMAIFLCAWRTHTLHEVRICSIQYVEFTCTQCYVCTYRIYVYKIIRVHNVDLVMLCMYNTQNIHERNIQHLKLLYVSTIFFLRTFSNRTYIWTGYVTNTHIQRNVSRVTLLNVCTICLAHNMNCTFQSYLHLNGHIDHFILGLVAY